jgi:hypothetical protein
MEYGKQKYENKQVDGRQQIPESFHDNCFHLIGKDPSRQKTALIERAALSAVRLFFTLP